MVKRIAHSGLIVLATLSEGWAQSGLLAYDLEDLSQVIVEDHSATLTRSNLRETPASVTVITHRQIVESGARSLDEVLEIFVPSFATMYKVHGTQMGMRGIISDRNNKILLLVNGRNMNVKATDGGAITERWSATLGDIRKITVVSGPGSAVYGPGAIAGVISIETFNGFSFEGSDITLQAGVGEAYEAAELRYGRKFDNERALFLYYGLQQASGADDNLAPHKLAFDLTIERPAYGTVTTIEANRNFPFQTTPDGASFHSKPRHTAHIQYDTPNLSLWSRYTQSGEAMPTLQNLYLFPYYEFGQSYPGIFQNTGNTQRQWTTALRYRQAVDESLSLEYRASLMRSDMENVTLDNGDSGKKWSEQDYLLELVAHYTPSKTHAFALGSSYDWTRFKNERRLLARGDGTDTNGELPAPIATWHSDMFSLYGEYQGQWSAQTTLFAGLRLDKHRFSNWMVSPRLALVWMPTPEATWKAIYNRSVRHSDDADLYTIYLRTGEKGDVETIDHYELLYMHDFGEGRRGDLSFYYNRHQVVAFNQNSLLQEYIGTLRFYGIEARFQYEREKLSLQLSHSYTKEIDFDLADPDLVYQNISASPYGYGNDLANWNDHITKLYIRFQAREDLTLTGSLRLYWGLPGARDMADYNMEEVGGSLLLPLYTDGTRVFGASAFLNLGVHWRLSPALRVSLTGYDLLGLFDEDLNKRNFFQKTSHYRDTAPSLVVRLSYQF